MSIDPGIGSRVSHDISAAGETHPRYWILFSERENSPDDAPGDEDSIIGLRSATTAVLTDAKVYMGILNGALPSPVHNVAITDFSAGVLIETDQISAQPGVIFTPQGSAPTPVEGHVYYNLSTHQLILRDDTGWAAISAGTAVTSLDDLTDVTIAAPATGEHLVFNGSIWVNAALALGTSNQLLGMNSAGTAQEYKTFASNADFISIVHAAGSVTFNDATDPLFPKKTGWDNDAGDYLTIAFTDGSRTFTLTPASPYYYWIQGVKYSFSTPQQVVITDTEGLWYIYFSGSTLTASQTPWIITDDDKALVAYIYWNATANTCIFCGYELHTWIMDSSTHGLFHSTIGTLYQTGLALTDNADGTLDMSPGSIHDEDIDITITDSAGSDYFEQDLTPIQIPIYYLDGAGGDAKKVYNGTSNTYFAYQDGSGNPYWNEYTGGAWQLTSYANNAYGCYWIVATNDTDEPIIALIGQGSTSILPGTAQDNNPIESLNMGSMLAEFKILFRVTIRNTGTPYTTDEIEDFRASSIVPGTGYVANDHGALGGLQDDDHHQYLLADGTRPLVADWDAGSWKITAETFESDIVTGTSPMVVASTTVVANLNVDQVDGYDLDQALLQAASPTFVGLILSGAIATPTTITTSGNITCGNDLTITGGNIGAGTAPIANMALTSYDTNTVIARCNYGKILWYQDSTVDGNLIWQSWNATYSDYIGIQGHGANTLAGSELWVARNTLLWLTSDVPVFEIDNAGNVQMDGNLTVDGEGYFYDGESPTYYIKLGNTGTAGTAMLNSVTNTGFGMWFLDTNKIWAFSNSYSWANAFKIITDYGATGTTLLSSGNFEGIRLDNAGLIYNRVDDGGFHTGAADDLRMYHNGTNSYLTNDTGTLYISSAGSSVLRSLAGAVYLDATATIYMRDVDDSYANLLRLDTTGRTFTIGSGTDVVDSTFYGFISSTDYVEVGELGSAPGTPSHGMIYYHTGDDILYGYIDSGWVDLGAAGGSGIGGSGTAGYIPKFSAGTTLTDSIIQDDGAGTVTITSAGNTYLAVTASASGYAGLKLDGFANDSFVDFFDEGVIGASLIWDVSASRWWFYGRGNPIFLDGSNVQLDTSGNLQIDGDFTASGASTSTIAHGDTTYGLSTAITLALGTDDTKPGALRLYGSTAGGGGLIQGSTNNLHIDALGGNIYLGNYDNSTVYFNGTSTYITSAGTLKLAGDIQLVAGAQIQDVGNTNRIYVNYSGTSGIGILGPATDPGNDAVVNLGVDGNSLKVYTNDGYIDIGPKNTSWCHMYSNKEFYFNQSITSTGDVTALGTDFIGSTVLAILRPSSTGGSSRMYSTSVWNNGAYLKVNDSTAGWQFYYDGVEKASINSSGTLQLDADISALSHYWSGSIAYLYLGAVRFLVGDDTVTDRTGSCGSATSVSVHHFYYDHITASSLAVKKTEIVDISGTLHPDFDQISPKSYDLIDGEKDVIGFVADDLPTSVQSFDEEGKLAGVNINAMLAMLVDKIKEQDEKIKGQDERIRKLEAAS